MDQFLSGTAANIASKMLEYAVEPLVCRPLGYLFCYGCNLAELRRGAERLERSMGELEFKLLQATSRGEEINETTKKWLADADKISRKVDEFVDDVRQYENPAGCFCANCFSPNPVLRYKLSRRAKKMTASVLEIQGDRCKLEQVSYVPILKNVIETKGYMAFDTRSSIVSGILEAFGKDEIRSIGVYGMPGIGKTTLAREVARRALDEEKLFSDVVEVTVSQHSNVENIQQEIADRLNLTFHEQGLKARAIRLRHRLKKEEKFLIILDDVWQKLDLLDIGIVFEEHQKGCKILLTSRFQNLLQDMDVPVENNFKVELLSKSEAWACFSNIIGHELLDDRNSREFEELGSKIVDECACLPLAIVTVAGALKNSKLDFVWSNALRRLQRSAVDEKVYSSVKLSYDFLHKEEAAKIFLCCSLLEEEKHISIQRLLSYVIGWGSFKDVYCLEEIRDRLHELLHLLQAHGLLLIGNDGDSVKIHDVIRDVGISIASEDPNNMYNIRSSEQLIHCLDDDKLKDAIAISMGANCEDQCLPPSLKCPNLHLLSMSRRCLLPNNFFEETKELRVLDLGYSCLKSLPQSLCFLPNLRALHLVGADLEDIDFIGELRKLKVLDFAGSTLERLPEQIGQLTRLQMLNLSKCHKLKVIPSNVISRLVNLEELNMERSFNDWKVEGTHGKENNASLIEIKNLAKLTALYLQIPEVNMLPESLFQRLELKRFNITFGDYDGHLGGSSTLELKFGCNVSSLMRDLGFRMLMKRSMKLCIEKVSGLKNLVYQFDSEAGLPHLEHLKIEHNSEIQYIIKPMEHRNSKRRYYYGREMLPRLETFYFYCMELRKHTLH